MDPVAAVQPNAFQQAIFYFVEVAVVVGIAFWGLCLVLGAFDMLRFLREIRSAPTDPTDDGRVTHH